ncbi:MAG: S-layer homology domain-containing protein, partial [Firmicutes bacterium]|nr:S-layer homology domain-containing protein [Bacillota bacterium]
IPAYATEAERTTAYIGGAQAQIAYITLSPTSVVCPLIPAGGICTDDYAAFMISDSPATVVAAINGSFFNSYYKKDRPLDINTGNYAAMYGAIVTEGKMISSGGSAALGFGYDGTVRIGRVDLAATLTVGDLTFVCWGVNQVYNQNKAVYALTSEMPYAVNVPAGSTIVEVKDGVVQSKGKGRNGYRPPEDGVALVFESHYPTLWDVSVGDEATYSYSVRSGDAEQWSGLRYIIGASGMLVENGVNVVDKNNLKESKLQPDAPGECCFIALAQDGRLMLGAVYSTFRKIADYLVKNGASDAILLDGGGSSMLYANGKYMNSPGRKLASLVAVIDPTVPPFDEPSDWAMADVEAAAELGILPEALDCNYLTDITREEFCALISGYIEAKTGDGIDRFSEGYEETENISFSDTSDAATLGVARLGIVNGYPDGTFRPNDCIIRQDAAIILSRLAKIMGADFSGPAKAYTDRAQISPYAVPGVDFVSGLGIMNGNANGSFSPHANITREQAVVTVMNTWRSIEYSDHSLSEEETRQLLETDDQ